MKNIISTEFKNSTSYNLVEINDIERDVRIVEESSVIKNPNKKRVLCKPSETISIGDLVSWNSEYWLCTEEDKTNPVHEVGLVTKCNNTLSVYKNGVITQVPCIVETNINLYKLGTDTNKYLSEPSSNIVVVVQNNAITSQIKRDEIYKLRTQSYKVTDWNDDIQPNMIVLKMEYSSEIAEVYTFAVNILNGTSIQVNENDSLTINVQVLENGIPLSPTPSLVFSSSNITKATINTNTGVVTFLDVGTVIFTCKLASNLTILDTISVEIVETEVDNFTYTLEGESEIIKGYSESYQAKKYNNGVLVSGTEFTFSIINGSVPTSVYTLTVVDADECSIKANLAVYSVTLRATDNSNAQFVEKTILLKNIF